MSENESEKREVRWTRQGAVLGALAGAAGVVGALSSPEAARATRPFAPGFAETVLGRIRRIVSPAAVEIGKRDGSAVTIPFTDGALFWREGVVALDSFAEGEEVVIEGESTANGFVGSAMINLYHGVETEVVSKKGTVVQTRSGPFRLLDTTRYQHHGRVDRVPERLWNPRARVALMGRRKSDCEIVVLRVYEPEHGAS